MVYLCGIIILSVLFSCVYFWWNTKYLIAWKKTKFNKFYKTTTTFNDDRSTVHSYVVKQWLLAFVSRELYPEQKADLKKLRNHLISSSSELAALKVWELQGNRALFLLIKTIKVLLYHTLWLLCIAIIRSEWYTLFILCLLNRSELPSCSEGPECRAWWPD